jgi:hypothetical protein
MNEIETKQKDKQVEIAKKKQKEFQKNTKIFQFLLKEKLN